MTRIDELVRATLDHHADEAPSPIPVVNRVLADRTRRRRRGWLVAAASAAATATVVAIGVGVTRDPDSVTGPSTTDVVSDADRTVEIYSAVLERFIRKSSWNGIGVPHRVWVAIEPKQRAGWTWGTDGETGEPLPPDVRDAISAELAPLIELVWVEKLPKVDPDRPGRGKPATTLGLLPAGEERFEVAISGVQGFDHHWLKSYIIERSDGHWSITGPGHLMGTT